MLHARANDPTILAPSLPISHGLFNSRRQPPPPSLLLHTSRPTMRQKRSMKGRAASLLLSLAQKLSRVVFVLDIYLPVREAIHITRVIPLYARTHDCLPFSPGFTATLSCARSSEYIYISRYTRLYFKYISIDTHERAIGKSL